MTETFRELADRRTNLKEVIAAAQKTEKQAKEELAALDLNFISKLEQDDGTSWSDDKHTFYISETTVPDVQDWDKFYEYILNEKAFYLLQRRAAVTAYRELLSQGVQVPGCIPFVKKSLGQRKK